VRLGISFDGIEEVNDYIRYPSKFSIMEKNLDRLDQAVGNFQVWLACTVSSYNIHHLVGIMRWVHSKNFKRIGKSGGKEFFVPHPVHMPEFLNIQAIPDPYKEKNKKHLAAELSEFLKDPSLSDAERGRAQHIIDQYIRFMESRSLSHQWLQFMTYTRDLDKIRGQDYRSLKTIHGF
jgi:hypothetical protein